MSRSWELFLRGMLEAARKVIRYTGEREVEGFAADEMAYDATLRNLEILGEAAKKIPDEIRQRYPLMFILFHLVVIIYEEPALEARFGESYRTYRGAVPRWGFTVHPFAPGRG